MRILMKKRTFKIVRDEGGYEALALDVLTSAYYSLLQKKLYLALILPTDDELPFRGYLIETTQIINQVILEREQEFLQGVPGELQLPEAIRAVRISIRGGKDKGDEEDYAEGCKKGFATGILKTDTQKWSNCRRIRGFWAVPIWDSVGFDFEECLLWREMKKVKCRDQFGFFKMQPAIKLLKRKERLSLVINMLFNYWERKNLSYTHRALHLLRLGFDRNYGDTNVGHYFTQAGCVPPSKEGFLDEFESIRKRAIRYYNKHPDEREILEEEAGSEFHVGLPRFRKK
jgi:hypothetical protein